MKSLAILLVVLFLIIDGNVGVGVLILLNKRLNNLLWFPKTPVGEGDFLGFFRLSFRSSDSADKGGKEFESDNNNNNNGERDEKF